MKKYRARTIPWLRVVQFHKDIVARAEEGFFSLNGGDDQAERWTSLSGFEPADMAGPWPIATSSLRSRPFQLALFAEAQLAFEQGDIETAEAKLEELRAIDPSYAQAAKLVGELVHARWFAKLPLSYSAKHDHKFGSCDGVGHTQRRGDRFHFRCSLVVVAVRTT